MIERDDSEFIEIKVKMDPKIKFDKPEYILNLISHRLKFENSGLVSCTSNIKIAKGFSHSVGRTGNGYVYLVRVIGGYFSSKPCKT